MKTFSLFDKIILILLIMGALLQGTSGLLGVDLMTFLPNPIIGRIISIIIGLTGIWAITFPFRFK